MKEAIVFHRIKDLGGGRFYGIGKLVDAETGEIVDEYEREYEKAHIIYAAYKVFQRILQFAHEHDYELLTLETNVEKFAEEITDKPRVNTTLYNQTMSRLYGASIAGTKVVA